MISLIKKYLSLFLMIIIIILCLLYTRSCNTHKSDLKTIAALNAYKHEVKKYESKNGTTVNYNNTIAVTPEDLKISQDTLLSYIEDLKLKIKNVKSSVIVTERLVVDTIKIPMYISDCEFDTTVHVEDTHYQMDIAVANTGLSVNRLEFPNRLGVTLTEKRNGLFKPKESIVAITNSNPYMQIDGISSYSFPHKKKWYEQWWVPTLGGAIVGVVSYRFINK